MSTTASMMLAPSASCRTGRILHAAHARVQRAQELYLSCAAHMEESSLTVIAHAFRFTAAQEKEQAAILRGLSAAMGETAPPPGEEHPPLPADPAALLDHFVHLEQSSAGTFREDAQIADGEDHFRVAGALLRMADTEEKHARRFRQYAEALRTGTLFRAPNRVSWVCLNCGELHVGKEPPLRCAGCGVSGGFLRSSGFPFAVDGW